MKNITVKKILTSNVVSILPDTPLAEAVSLMEKNKISCLVIAEDQKPVGILTERDLVVAMDKSSGLEGLTVRDLISGRVVSAHTGIDIFEALDILKTNKIRHLIIIHKNGKLAGLITQSDIRNNLGFEYFIEIKQISSIMTKNIVTSVKGSSVQDVISRMAEYAISCIIVEKDGYPVGMLTERDVVGLLNKGPGIKKIKIEEVMISPVLTIMVNAPVHEASKIMNQNNIRRLVVVDEDGKSTGLITQSDIIKRFEKRYIEVLKDIIQEKEEALRKTRKQLSEKVVLDNIMRSSMDMAIVASDLDYQIIYFNSFAEKIFGLKAGKAIGKTAVELFKDREEDLARFMEAVEEVKKGEDCRYVSDWTERGSVHFIESVVSGIRDIKDNLKGFVLMSKDITKRKLADEALQNSEKKYRNFVDNALVGIFQTNVNGDVLFVNDALLRILGFDSQDEAIKDGIIRRFRDPEKIVDFIEALLERGKVDNFETEIRTKTDTTINLLLSATMEGEVISAVMIDLTRAKNLEEQLHQSQKMEALGTLTGGIAHEFNNILMIITTSGELLKGDVRDGDPLMENIEQIISAARKAARITQGLLTYTRTSLPNKEPTDVNGLIKSMSGYLSNIIRKDIDFDAVTADKPLAVLADRTQIEQVIMNLATNSVDAMHKAGSLTIRSEPVVINEDGAGPEASLPPGAYALISVADTGAGMDRETQTRIFEPFYTTKAVGKGTGIGLSIVYGIIKKHSGWIYVESVEGSGTTIKIYLPLIQAEGIRELARDDSPEAGGSGTILFAEDDELVMKVTAKVLEKAGYRIISAGNGEEALRLFSKHEDEINLLLFDMQMPGMSGWEAYEEIKKAAPDMNAVFFTGYLAEHGARDNTEKEGVAFLEKPVSPNELKGKIKEMLK